MDSKLFAELVESMTQMNAIARGERAPSRTFHVAGTDVQRIREATGLSQTRFARLVAVPVGTLRNWEQGRREPTGPAKVLLKVIESDPAAVLRTIAQPSSLDHPPPVKRSAAVRRADTTSKESTAARRVARKPLTRA